MESFFSLLQKNVLDRKPWSTREKLRLAIVHWIEARYRLKRRQRRLGKLTAVEFETIMGRRRSGGINPGLKQTDIRPRGQARELDH